jgi:uncharacterized protein
LKAILITGAGTGLGRELALCYSDPSSTMLLIGRHEQSLMKTKELISAKGHPSDYYICDITSPELINDISQQISQNFQLNMLINNAGTGYFGKLDTLSDKSIHSLIMTNVLGTIYMTKYFLPLLKQQSKSKILNIISTAGLSGKVNESVYCASKFAVRGFTESIQKELEQTSVSVSSVYMGGMDTPFWDSSDHILDPTRLKSAKDVAENIKANDDGRLEIHV